MNNRDVSFCDCHSPDHLLVFDVEDTDFGDGVVTHKCLVIYYNLRHYASFWKRLKNAYKYVTKSGDTRVDYLDIMLSDPQELARLKDVVDEVYEFNARVRN